MPVQPLDAKTVTALVDDATAAPSMHNAQPWRFRFFHDSRTLDVRSDPERAMPHADPTGRALHLGCAAALFNLRVAATHAGWEPATRLLPEPADPDLLATVRLIGPARAGSDLALLHPAVHRRHSSRYPFAETEIPTAVKIALCDAASLEGARLAFPAATHVAAVLALVQDAEVQGAMDPGAAAEIARWTRVGAEAADTATDGIPEYAFGPRKRGGGAPMRDFAGRRPVSDRGTAQFEGTPQLALLSTARDRPEDWLRAGQAMERVLLLATLNRLSSSLTSQALEWPDLRWAVRDPEAEIGYVQMVLRLGYGPQGPVTPRRPVREVLDFE